MARTNKPRSPGCIVLAPTRELAKQVEREFAATGPTLRTACVYGGGFSVFGLLVNDGVSNDVNYWRCVTLIVWDPVSSQL